MTPDVVIRCDVGGSQGLGHCTRMRALAQVLVARGVSVAFDTITPALTDFMAPLPVRLLQGDTYVVDAPINVFDHKSAPGAEPDEARVYRRLRDKGVGIVRIDAPQAEADTADLLILPNAHPSPATLARLRQDFGERLLSGWDYVMLEEEVTSQTPIPYAARTNGPIVFCAGGSDPGGTIQLMAEWAGALPKDLLCIFAMPQYSHRAYVMPRHAHTTPFSRDLLRQAALVVTTFGQTCYEALWWRTPTLCLAQTAENEEAAHHLMVATIPTPQSTSGVLYIGSIVEGSAHRTTATAFCANIRHAWDISRQAMHHATIALGSLYDALGVERVAEAIVNLGV